MLGVRGNVRTSSTPPDSKPSANSSVNLVSRSKIRYFGGTRHLHHTHAERSINESATLTSIWVENIDPSFPGQYKANYRQDVTSDTETDQQTSTTVIGAQGMGTGYQINYLSVSVSGSIHDNSTVTSYQSYTNVIPSQANLFETATMSTVMDRTANTTYSINDTALATINPDTDQLTPELTSESENDTESDTFVFSLSAGKTHTEQSWQNSWQTDTQTWAFLTSDDGASSLVYSTSGSDLTGAGLQGSYNIEPAGGREQLAAGVWLFASEHRLDAAAPRGCWRRRDDGDPLVRPGGESGRGHRADWSPNWYSPTPARSLWSGDAFQELVNFSAGVSDALTFGYFRGVARASGVIGVLDTSSQWYGLGTVAGGVLKRRY